MSRVMAAQLFLLARDDVRWRTDGERIYWAPADALDPSELGMARDLKPEVIALLSFTPEQREVILRLDPKVDLVGLARYRQGLDLWDRFTRQEQTILQGQPWGLEDLENIHSLRGFSQGTVEACRQNGEG